MLIAFQFSEDFLRWQRLHEKWQAAGDSSFEAFSNVKVRGWADGQAECARLQAEYEAQESQRKDSKEKSEATEERMDVMLVCIRNQ